MKSFLVKTAFLLSLVTSLCSGLYAQKTKLLKKEQKTAAIKSLVESKSYVFIAQSVFPMNGNMRNITPDYNVAVAADSVVSYLPFFGRAYVATIGETRSPLDFKTKSFLYTITPAKKDGWDIIIKPKDLPSIQSMYFFISSQGYASLQVISTDRSAITFNGYVTERKEQKKEK